MAISKVVSITLPSEVLARAERLARKERCTMSELIREALRRYQREREWDELNAYGRAKAAAAGIAEADVPRVVKQFRKERRAARQRRAG